MKITASARRRLYLDLRHPLIAFTGIGPLSGTVLFYLGCGLFLGPTDLPLTQYPIAPFLWVGYVAGLLPAMVTGLLFGFLRRRSTYLPQGSPARRGLVFGALCGLVVMFPVEATGILSHSELTVLTNILTLCGVFAGGVCGAICRAPFPAVDQPAVFKASAPAFDGLDR